MRISTNQMQQGAINAIMKQDGKLSRTQQQVATGKKIFKPSDNPVAASRVVNLKDTLSSIDQHQQNIDAARSRITITEGILSNVVDALHRIRELTVEANNDSQNDSTRQYIGAEVSQLQDALLNLANSTDSNNEYLFAGSLSRFKPFYRDENGNFGYNGDESSREVQISRTRRIAVDDPGSAVFREIKNGNGNFTTMDGPKNQGTGVIDPGRASGDYVPETYGIIFDKSSDTFDETGEPVITFSVIDSKGKALISGEPFEEGKSIIFNGVHTSVTGKPEDGDYFVVKPSQNQDVFTTVEHLIRALNHKSPEAQNSTSFHNTMNRSLTDLTQVLDNILKVRGDNGARLNALDGQQTINDAYRLQIREILSGVEDLDYAEASSRLNLQLTGLEASQKAFTRVQDISLFNFL